MKILLVEDHPGSRRNLQRLIARRGHDVTAVGSAEEAEAALAADKFPFLILDWMLPGKSGVDLCRELRAGPNGDEMFILLVTAKADTEDLQQALEAGANDYLTKPLDIELLNVRISVAERQIRELSERNQARAALVESARTMTNILENTTDGFFAVDSDWKLTYINAEAETMVGCKRDELLGGLFWEKFPALVGSIFQTNYERVMAEQNAMEFEAVDASGKIWYDVHAYPSNGGVSVFFRDISERKKSETERLTTSKLESLGTLAGGIAHDLNNILTVISGNIGLAQLEAPADSGSLLGFLSKAGQAAQHAAHLSSQLLTFSKGGAPLKKVVSMGELLEHSAVRPLRVESAGGFRHRRRSLEGGSRRRPDRASCQRVDAQCARSDAAGRHSSRSRPEHRLRGKHERAAVLRPLHQNYHQRPRLRDLPGAAHEDLRSLFHDEAECDRTRPRHQLLGGQETWRIALAGEFVLGRLDLRVLSPG
jgi:PAS domain S-box-containing protein